ncbi:SOS response regulatory protein OraA/RecX [Nocardia mexicana]|uniref:Regulatory protein RecX n=1 Tax=Nocardia mexicana TaxID=279262 RepID=A0A370GFD1_9NOCA|nr:SOS response regulatory protein OraA/RecX [Nocardia mexicana]
MPSPSEHQSGGTETQAKNTSMRLLAEHARSRAELGEELAANGFAADVIHLALDELTEIGLLGTAPRRTGVSAVTDASGGSTGDDASRFSIVADGSTDDEEPPIRRRGHSRKGVDSKTDRSVADTDWAATGSPDDAEPRGRRRRETSDGRGGGTGRPHMEADVPQSDRRSEEFGEDADGRGRRRGRRRRGEKSGSEPEGGGTEAQAKDVCLRLLTDRARSRSELADKLAAKGFTPDVAERVLNRLAEVGLIDDAAFAEQWVHSRHTYSGKGKKVIAQELRRKGVASADAEPALASVTTEDENVRAAELVRRKLNSLPAHLTRDKAMSRLVGMLARRGYNPSTAYTVVKAELSDIEFDDSRADSARKFGNASRPLDIALAPADHATATGHRDVDEYSGADGYDDAGGSSTTEHGTAAEDSAADHNPAADHDSAAELVRRKLRTMPRNLDREKTIRRLVGMLARRGYNQSTAYTVVKEELAAAEFGE